MHQVLIFSSLSRVGDKIEHGCERAGAEGFCQKQARGRAAHGPPVAHNGPKACGPVLISRNVVTIMFQVSSWSMEWPVALQ